MPRGRRQKPTGVATMGTSAFQEPDRSEAIITYPVCGGKRTGPPTPLGEDPQYSMLSL